MTKLDLFVVGIKDSSFCSNPLNSSRKEAGLSTAQIQCLLSITVDVDWLSDYALLRYELYYNGILSKNKRKEDG